MDWKEKLGIGIEEDLELEEVYVFSREVDDYFKSLGFYVHTMNPRFFNEIQYRRLTLDVPVLRYDGDWDSDNRGVQRIFMNGNEIYVERQTNYRSFDSSSYHKFKKRPPESINEIETILNRLIRKYEE